MQSNKSLEDLEKIYGAKKNLRNQPDLNYDKLRISKDEYNQENASSFQKKGKYEDDLEAYEEAIHSRKKDEFNEIKSFLPTSADQVISSRYESPLRSMKLTAIKWKIFAIFLLTLSTGYSFLHLWALFALFNPRLLPASPTFILEMAAKLEEMKDVLFNSYLINIVIDFWALAICSTLLISLIKDRLSHLEGSSDLKEGRFLKIVTRLAYWSIVIFAMSYIVGTLDVLYIVRPYATHNSMVILILFHLSKMMYIIFNIIAFKKYKSRKSIYEDLLLEALGNTNSGEEDSNEEENQDNLYRNSYYSDA